MSESETMPTNRPVDVTIVGPVIHGDERGRTIGFPTANLEVDPAATPSGVFAGLVVRADGTLHHAAVNVGRRPTFERNGAVLLEAHLLDFDGDLYGEVVTVRLVAFIRPERRLPSIEALVSQLRDDVTSARRMLTRLGRGSALAA